MVYFIFHMNRISILSILTIIWLQGCTEKKLTAEDILNNSIRYHDPEGRWSTLQTEFQFDEVQPTDSTPVVRKTRVWIDNQTGNFKIDRGGREIHGVRQDSCFIVKGDVSCDRALTLRNYYLYLWGLPMKLKDNGTTLNTLVTDTTWQEVPVYKLQVAYEKDDWSYYFGKENFALVGYSFRQHSGGGEHIFLESEYEYAGMRIPRKRSWYTLAGKFLGTDILTGSDSFE